VEERGRRGLLPGLEFENDRVRFLSSFRAPHLAGATLLGERNLRSSLEMSAGYGRVRGVSCSARGFSPMLTRLSCIGHPGVASNAPPAA